MPTRLGAPVGTLNVYCDRPRVWDESEIAALEAYNSLLEARLAESLLTQQHDRVVGQLQFALDSRVTIERAIGLLMGRDGIDGATAFNELRRAARSSRRRVNAVAEEVLAEHPQAVAGRRARPDGLERRRRLAASSMRPRVSSTTVGLAHGRSPTRGSTARTRAAGRS